ncbi:MAG: hypothetical protein ACI4W7_00590 [Candidatus Spyradenecus sp.]
MIHQIMLSVLIPPQFRKHWIYRDVKLYTPTIGHALLIDKLCPDGIRSPEEHAMAAIILRHSYATAAHILCNGKTTNADHDAAPKDEAERLSLLNYIALAWRAPARFEEPTRGPKPIPHHAAKEYASTAALRLALRVASLPGIRHLLPCDLLDLPIPDAIALLIADDELHGAHYLSADTEARFRDF